MPGIAGVRNAGNEHWFDVKDAGKAFRFALLFRMTPLEKRQKRWG